MERRVQEGIGVVSVSEEMSVRRQERQNGTAKVAVERQRHVTLRRGSLKTIAENNRISQV